MISADLLSLTAIIYKLVKTDKRTLEGVSLFHVKHQPVLSRQSRCLSFAFQANGRLVVKPSFLFFFLTWLTLVLEPQLTRKKELDEILEFPYGRSCIYVWNQHAIHLQKEHSIQTVHFRLKRYPHLMPFRLLSSPKLLNDYLLRKIYENCCFPRVAWRHFKTERIS